MLKIIKISCAERSFNKKIFRISTRPTNQLAKGALVKTEQNTLTNAQIDSLLTKIAMDNEGSL